MIKVICDDRERASLFKLIESRGYPYTVSVANGKRRTDKQNRLQRDWMTQLAEQGDMTAEEYRGYCKLHFGVPILRDADAAFREAYDLHIKHLPYESKIAAMMVPLDMPVTRLMTTAQKTRYLDDIYKHFTRAGFALTEPKQ